MKKLVYLLVTIFFWAGCDKSDENLLIDQHAPEAVVKAIASRFDSIKNLTLGTLKTNALYAADFQSKNLHYKAILQSDGALLSLGYELPVSNLPANARVYIDIQYPGAVTDTLYQITDPATAGVNGYMVQFRHNTRTYFMSFDLRGARISEILVTNAVWWRYGLPDNSIVPANILNTLQTMHPGYVFRSAALLVAPQQFTWLIEVSNGNFVEIYQFDDAGTIIGQHEENLLDINNIQPTYLDLLNVAALPAEVTDFLNNQFTGWVYERGLIVVDQSNTAVGFLVIITLNQDKYYVRFDVNGIFTGANKV